MNIKQKQLGIFSKIKYSEIQWPENGSEERARVAMGYLLKNGYAVMSGFAMNEVMNLIRSLRELRLEYTMKLIDTGSGRDNSVFYYEFTLGYFEDDRVSKPPAHSDINLTITGAVVTKTPSI